MGKLPFHLLTLRSTLWTRVGRGVYIYGRAKTGVAAFSFTYFRINVLCYP